MNQRFQSLSIFINTFKDISYKETQPSKEAGNIDDGSTNSPSLHWTCTFWLSVDQATKLVTQVINAHHGRY